MAAGRLAARRRSSACSTVPATALPAELAHPFFWAPFALIGEGGGAARHRRGIADGISPDYKQRPWTIDQLGKYEIRGTLGSGAMGTVYEGWDPIIERTRRDQDRPPAGRRRRSKRRRSSPASSARRRPPAG